MVHPGSRCVVHSPREDRWNSRSRSQVSDREKGGEVCVSGHRRYWRTGKGTLSCTVHVICLSGCITPQSLSVSAYPRSPRTSTPLLRNVISPVVFETPPLCTLGRFPDTRVYASGFLVRLTRSPPLPPRSRLTRCPTRPVRP